jgi:hypothetical protein
MANVYTVTPILISVTTANQDVYEVPAATTSIIRSISVYNTDSSTMNVTLSVYDTSATTRYTYDYKAALAATTKFEFLNSSNSILLVLEETDKLQVTCETTGGLNLIVSALEISRA